MSNQLSKFRTENWVEINNGACGKYNTNGQIKFKTAMLKSSFFDYSDSYTLVKRMISVVGQVAGAATITADRNDKEVIFKKSAPFTELHK